MMKKSESPPETQGVLINTPLQRGDREEGGDLNRFSGFHVTGAVLETAKAVEISICLHVTPLKQGVNERTVKKATSCDRIIV